MGWIDCGNYWISDNPQRTDDWLEDRKGRITGSVSGSCVGHSKFKSPPIAALEISGKKKPNFTPHQLKIMEYGTVNEPVACDWYKKINNVIVEELGLVVPKWNIYLGASVDGVVKGTDGIIEIKCPQKMYYPLENYLNNTSKPDDYSHIWKSHYDQMQLGMAILEKKWCDYIIFCIPEDKVFTQRIPWNQSYWDNEFNPKLNDFIDNRLKPLLIDTKYPISPK